MLIKSYRAASIQDALHLVREELGPDATVLQAREVSGNWIQRLLGQRQVEVTAVEGVAVPSRFANGEPASVEDHRVSRLERLTEDRGELRSGREARGSSAESHDDRANYVPNRTFSPADRDMSNQPAVPPHSAARSAWTHALFRLFADLLDAEFDDDVARELVNRLMDECLPRELHDLDLLRSRLVRLVESQIRVHGPIQVVPGHPRLVALVGPTGVGKTTTIAKLAANFHLREHRRVGLITVDTYRIAAIDQLRTYAQIIDLPMEVVSTPQEMPEAMARLGHLDLVLMDTAGRGPCDDVRIQELKDMLQMARADEVHLVLSAVTGRASLLKTARSFRQLRATALLLTKLDEATGLGNVLPLLKESPLPLSYVTHGQNVPDDIAHADARRLARQILPGDAVRGANRDYWASQP